MDKPKTLDEIGPYFIEQMNKLGPEVVGLSWNVRWSNRVSNTHRAPKGYKTNFGFLPTLPTGFPGWEGRVWIRFKDRPDFMGLSNMMGENGIHPGSGGGGAYDGPWAKIGHAAYLAGLKYDEQPHCFSWDAKIFDLDWESVDSIRINKQEYERQYSEYSIAKTWAILQGNYSPPFNFKAPSHKFEWTDPVTLIEDKKFIATNVLKKY